MTSMEKLRAKLLEISHVRASQALLAWDQETFMPAKGANFRAATLSTMAGLSHLKATDSELVALVDSLNTERLAGHLSEEDSHIIRETKRDLDRLTKLPVEFVRKMAELTSLATEVWREARGQSKFELFAPWLQKIVDVCKEEVGFLGYQGSSYNALLDLYEPDMTVDQLDRIFGELKTELVPLLAKIKAKVKFPPAERLRGNFSQEKQSQFGQKILKAIGFDLTAGREDESTHPFTMGMHPTDVRLTTRYDPADIKWALFSTIHEGGHGVYEQGLPERQYGTPLGEATSTGLHESQSRLWENLVGRSRAFWEFMYPELQKMFPAPFATVPLDDFYRGINLVRSSAIRTESDEVSYNLHIILRYEIERALMEGRATVADVPGLWKAKMKEYLGYEVKNDAEGPLQDIHWSGGSFGYFPTYTLGNIYAAQIFKAMQKDLGDVDGKLRRGEILDVKAWLNKNVHQYGRAYSAAALVEKLSGEPVSSKYLLEYLRDKYQVMM